MWKHIFNVQNLNISTQVFIDEKWWNPIFSKQFSNFNFKPRWQDVCVDDVAVSVSDEEREEPVEPFEDVEEERSDGPLPEVRRVKDQQNVVGHVQQMGEVKYLKDELIFGQNIWLQ